MFLSKRKSLQVIYKNQVWIDFYAGFLGLKE